MPPEEPAKKLLDAPLVPGVNMPNPERSSHVAWALNLLDMTPDRPTTLFSEMLDAQNLFGRKRNALYSLDLSNFASKCGRLLQRAAVFQISDLFKCLRA
jgi:hypothetical protein